MKCFHPILLCAFVGFSCSNPGKKEESDRKNLYQAEFFYEQGFPGRAMQHARRIKETSPRYEEAQEWVSRIEGDQADAGFSE